MNLYYPGIPQRPGPEGNVYPDTNAVAGVILHSAEGRWVEGNMPRDIMAARGVSWHFSVYTDGRVEQHYPLTASCWHAGHGSANKRLIGIEHEGSVTPIAGAQLAASIALVRWIAAQGGWEMGRGGTLFEHREFSATTCPSGRIPWDAYEEADVLELQSLNQSEAIEAVKESARAVGPDGGIWYEVTGGYTPKPGRKAYLVEVVLPTEGN